MAFVLALCFNHLFFFCFLGLAVLRDCGISWESSFIFLLKHGMVLISLLQIRGISRYYFFFKSICCMYSLDAPPGGASNEYHNIWFNGEIRKKYMNNYWLKKHII